MKRNLLILFVLAGYVATVMSCSTNDDDSNDDNGGNPNIDVNQTTQIAQSGDWKITTFIDSGDNETNHFTGYTFTFNSDGSLVATNGTDTVNGTWSITNSSGSSSDDDDGSSSSGPDFNINFLVSDDNKFEDLNDDWDFISSSSNKIELIDISGGNGGTDYLTFEKL